MSTETEFPYGANNGSDNFDLGSIVLTPFEDVNDAIGTITKATKRIVTGKDGRTHAFGELTISYFNGNDEAREATASIYLGDGSKEISNSSKALLIQLRDATGSTDFKGTEGARVKFSAKQQKDRKDQGNFTYFGLPA